MLQLVATALLCATVVEQTQAEERAAEAPAVQVNFRNEALFAVRAPAGKLSPHERGAAIEARLRAIAAQGDRADLERIHQIEREQSTDLHVGDSFLLSVLDADALLLGRTRRQLAADDAVALRRALDREYRDRSFKGVLKAALLTLLASAVLAALLRGLFVSWFRVQARIEAGTRHRRRRHREVAARRADPHHQECRRHHLQRDGARQPHRQLQRLRGRAGTDPPQHRDHRLRHAVASGPRAAPGGGARGGGLHQAIQDRFNEAGVEIMSPHYAAVRDGNAAALPEEALPKDYEAPTFRLGRRKGAWRKGVIGEP